MTFHRSLIVAAASLLLSAGVVAGQGLGEVARKEADRRKEVKATGKVYTNETLRDPGPAPTPPPTAAPATPPPSAKPDAKAGAGTTAAKATPDATRGEKYWKDRLASAHEKVDRSKTFAEALQTRINALTTDFTSRSDPAQRDQIFADRQKALAELERVRKEIDEGTKAIADIQEEGRKAGVPAGWLR